MLPVLNRDNLWCSAGQILTIARIAEIEKGVASTKPRPQSSRFGGTPIKTLALVFGMHRARSQPIERSFIRAPHPSHLAHNIVNNVLHARLNRYCLFRKTANVGNHGRLIEIAIQLIMKFNNGIKIYWSFTGIDLEKKIRLSIHKNIDLARIEERYSSCKVLPCLQGRCHG